MKNKIIGIALFSLFFLSSAISVMAGIPGDEALKVLLEGNQRFVKGQALHPHQAAKDRVKTAKEGQKPVAAILSCSDSRVPLEILFDAGIGDIFVIRVAGNIASKDTLGSIEYAVEHLGVNLIMVLGHTKCGAVTTVVNNDHVTGNILSITKEIKPVVAKIKTNNKNLTGEKLILEATKANVERSIEKIKESSGLSSNLKVVGTLYNIETGSISLLKTPAN